MILFYIAFGLLLVFLLLCLIIGYITMRFVIYPKRTTYEEAEQIEKSKNFWGDYDSYEKEEFNVISFDGYELNGVLIKNQSDKYVIVTHGYTYNMLGSIKYANIFYKLGYNVYIYDIRHHGKNKEFFCTMGQYEPRDIIAVQKALYQRFGEQITIGLHGESLGCASSILALELSQKFEFVVADCGFTDLHILFADQAWKMFHLPAFMVYFTDFWLSLLQRYRFSNIRPIEVMENNRVPILFFHGAADEFILPKHTVRGYEACKAYKEMYLIDGAGHAQSYQNNPETYAKRVATFIQAINSKNELQMK